MLTELSSNSLFLPALLSLFFLKNQIRHLRYIALFVLIAGITELTIVILGKFYIESMFNLNILFMFQIIMCAFIFNDLLNKNSFLFINKVFAYSIGVFSVINFFFIQGLFIENTYTYVLVGIYTMLLCILYFFELIEQNISSSLLSIPAFWFASGMFIYHAGSFFVHWLMRDYYREGLTLTFNLYDIHSVVNIILNICLTITLWKARKFRISPTS